MSYFDNEVKRGADIDIFEQIFLYAFQIIFSESYLRFFLYFLPSIKINIANNLQALQI